MHLKIKTFITTLLVIGLNSVWLAYPLQAEEMPKWEFGLGAGGLSVPHYRGSDQHENYIAPVPYIRYNGKRLKVDREGGRFLFYSSDIFKVDASTGFSLPVDSGDNQARQGMPDIDPIFELGPRMQFNLYESDDHAFQFRAALPVRAAITVNLSDATNAGPIWATKKYHDYFYQIDPEFATATRPAFDARAGYSGSRITLTSSKRFKNIWTGFFIRYDNLEGAVFENSPLVKQEDSLMAGVAITYIFKQSKQMVEIDK